MKRYLIILILVTLLAAAGVVLYSWYRETKRKADLYARLKSNPVGEVKATSFSDLKDGDILFQKSLSPESKFISQATKSAYSNCGVFFRIGKDNFVFGVTDSVNLMSLMDWMGKGVGGSFEIKRVKALDTDSSAPAIEILRTVSKKFQKRKNDTYLRWSDEQVYCSELVWKLYKEATGIELCKLQKYGSLDFSDTLFSGSELKKRRELYPDEFVVFPDSLFHSPILKTIELTPVVF